MTDGTEVEVLRSGMWVGDRRLKRGEVVEARLFGVGPAKELVAAGTLRVVEKADDPWETPAKTGRK